MGVCVQEGDRTAFRGARGPACDACHDPPGTFALAQSNAPSFRLLLGPSQCTSVPWAPLSTSQYPQQLLLASYLLFLGTRILDSPDDLMWASLGVWPWEIWIALRLSSPAGKGRWVSLGGCGHLTLYPPCNPPPLAPPTPTWGGTVEKA